MAAAAAVADPERRAARAAPSAVPPRGANRFERVGSLRSRPAVPPPSADRQGTPSAAAAMTEPLM